MSVVERLVAGEACKTIFRPTPGSVDRTFNSSEFRQQRISSPAAPHCRKKKGERIRENDVECTRTGSKGSVQGYVLSHSKPERQNIQQFLLFTLRDDLNFSVCSAHCGAVRTHTCTHITSTDIQAVQKRLNAAYTICHPLFGDKRYSDAYTIGHPGDESCQ